MAIEHTPKLHQQVDLNHFSTGLLELLRQNNLSVTTWSEVSPALLYEKLEQPNWAPWLEASVDSIAGRSEFFKEGQLVLIDQENQPVASLSTNLIQWDGNPQMLPSWDVIAGEPSDYSSTYKKDGNTLVLMSMNVDPHYQGKQLPAKLVQQVQLLAHDLGVEHLIGSFRPNQFGEFKKKSGSNQDFWHYATELKTERVDEMGAFGKPGNTVQLPQDGWLRSLSWLGMQPIVEDQAAMVVTVSLDEFNNFKSTYNPSSWWEDTAGIWHCSEVGSWEIDAKNKTAKYTESNLFGALPLLKEV